MPLKDKVNFYSSFDGARYIGWTRDSSRELLQLRSLSYQNQIYNTSSPTENYPIKWPLKSSIKDSNAILDAVNLLTKSAEDIFIVIGSALGLGSRFKILLTATLPTCFIY